MFRSLIPSAHRGVDRFEDPFLALQRNMNRMFEETLRWWPALGDKGGAAVVPSIDIKETDKAIVVSAELPGVDQKDLHATYAGGILTLKGEKKSEKEESKEGYQLSERSYGSFLRSLVVDDVDADRIEAVFENGVLRVTLPKAPSAQAKARTIEIKRAK